MSTGTGQSDIIPLMQFNFEQQQGSLNDLSSHGIVGTLTNCIPVDDQDMGMCQRFDGSSSYVTCSPTVIEADTAQSSVFENGITITSWVKFDSFPSSGYSYLLVLVGNGGTSISFYTQGNKLNYWSKDKSTSCETSLVTGQWYHLAIAVDNNGNAQFFVDGKPHSQTTDPALAPPNLNGPGPKQTIGGWDGKSYLQGTMAWMAVYNGAYQQPGILTDLAKGESKRFTSFRQSFPVGFKLNSDDGGAESPILFIESQGEGKDLHLRLQNTGSTPINFYAPSPAVTKASGITDENYHAQLRFRPGILAENYLAENAIDTSLKLGSETGTNWLATLKKDPSGTYSMSFLYTGSSPLPIPPQGEELIIIKEVNASAAQGSRNTNVEFQYQNVLPGKSPVTTGTNATVPMEGHRVQNISIVNHAGVKDIPLRAEIIGPTNVMTYSGASDVTPPESSLQFQLVNTGSKDLDLGLPSSADGATAFTLTIDVQPADYTAEWALIDHGVASKLTLALGDGESGWNADTAGSVPTGNPNQLQWTITNQSANSFAQGEGLTFTLSGIECSLPAGSTVVTIGYRHIPGHWQGAFELPVTKSPVTYSRSGIGINTQEPKANLHILEEKNIVPIEVQVPGTDLSALPAATKLPSPGVRSHLVPMGEMSNTYFDSMTISGTDNNNCYVHIWTIVGLGASQQSVAKVLLPGLRQKFAGGTCSPQYTYSDPYLCMSWTKSKNMVSLYTYNPNTSTASFVYDCDLGNGANPDYLAFHDGYIYCIYTSNSYKNASIRSYDTSQSPVKQVQSISLQLGEVDYTQFSFMGHHNGYLYFYVKSRDGTTSIYASNLGDGGLLGAPITVLSQLNYHPRAYVFTGNQLYISDAAGNLSMIDLSDLHTCTPKQFGNAGGSEPFCNMAIRENCLLVVFVTTVDIYDLSKPEPGTLFRSYSTVNENPFSAGVANDYLWTHDNNLNTQIYDIKSVLKTLLGHGSYISSRSISIGTPGLLDNAGLTISSGTDGMNPVNIVDESGLPIFKIKLPNGEGEPYRVGIGTDNPQAPLEVAGSTHHTSKNFSFLQYDPTHKNLDSGHRPDSKHPDEILPVNLSIIAENFVRAAGFHAISDLRIKDLLGASHPKNDLKTLLSFQVTNYQYIDFVGKGTGQKKGLIAQQVKEVFPQAVSAENTDFIPDIYAMATEVKWQQASQHLLVSLEKAHGLKVGDKVRLIAEKGFEEKEVVAVPDDRTFVVSEWEKSVDKLFVFGKEVHDFHTVDYDQVAMLGISAIQALHAEVECLKKEKEALKAEMQSEMTALKEEWAAFKSSITQQHRN